MIQQPKISYLIILAAITLFISCKKEGALQPDYTAPSELPDYLVPGTALNDSILQLYKDLGIVIYTNPADPRFVSDLVSNESLKINNRQPADTTPALLFIRMIREELYDQLPESKKYLTPRNFYFLKNLLITGTGYSQYYYLSYLWYNSGSDVTIGGLNASNIDTTFFKEALYYALSGILRAQPENKTFYTKFLQTKTDAGFYYWQVNSLTSAYEHGFLSDNQSKIRADQLDFDLFAAWGATVKPNTRDSLMQIYPTLSAKYQIVASMFRSSGIPLEQINADWQESELNPER